MAVDSDLLHESFLAHRGYRYLWAAIALSVVCVAVYTLDTPLTGRNGGTWVGWGLGTLCGVLVVWLMLLGARKRHYSAARGRVRGWLSAHVYLGTSLLLLVPLHAGFQVGWNVHTLAFALIVAVVLSGLLGVIAYGHLPTLISENRAGQSREGLIAEVAQLDIECEGWAQALPDQYTLPIHDLLESAQIGGGLWAQLRPRTTWGPTDRTIRRIEPLTRAASTIDATQMPSIRELIRLLYTRRNLLRQIGRDVQLKALLDLWLVAHIPLSFAALAAVFVHVVSVFYYR